MAKGTTKDILKVNDAAGTAENLESDTEVTKGESAEAPVTTDKKRVTVVMPRYLFTSDPDAEHHDIVDQGKIYQVKYDEPVSVPVSVAEIINNAIAQKKKVKALVDSLNGKAKEISEE